MAHNDSDRGIQIYLLQSEIRSCMHKYYAYLGVCLTSVVVLSVSLLTTLTNSYGIHFTNVSPNNLTVVSGYVNCLMNYATNECKDCPPNCITYKSNNVFVNNNELASKIGEVYEKSLRQMSIIEAADLNTNHTKTDIIYLQSLFLKNQIKSNELSLITSIFNNISQTNSTTILGKTLHSQLDNLKEDQSASPIATSIVSLLSENVDLLINSDGIIHKIEKYPNLPYDLVEQKTWLNSILSGTIVGCELSGPLGCLLASIDASGIY